MNDRRHRFHTLGSSIMLALGLLILAAGTAQAAEWLVNGKTLTELGVSERLITGLAGETAGAALILGIEFNCEHGEGHAVIKKGGIGTGTIGLTGCQPAETESCEITGGEIIANIKGTIVGSGMFILFQPASGSVFTTVTLSDTTEECILIEPGAGSEELQITGSEAGLVEGDLIRSNSSTSGQGGAEGLFVGNNELVLDGELLMEGLNGEVIGVLP